MNNYVSFFLNTKSSVLSIDCIEISHPSFAESFRYLRNGADLLSVQHEDGSWHEYSYQPLQLQLSNVTNDLDQTIQVTLADFDNQFLEAMVSIRNSLYPNIRPQLKYRVYRDDDLSAPLLSLQTLEIQNISRDTSGNCTFNAAAPQLNSVKTGEIYSLERFPLLRGLI